MQWLSETNDARELIIYYNYNLSAAARSCPVDVIHQKKIKNRFSKFSNIKVVVLNASMGIEFDLITCFLQWF